MSLVGVVVDDMIAFGRFINSALTNGPHRTRDTRNESSVTVDTYLARNCRIQNSLSYLHDEHNFSLYSMCTFSVVFQG